MFLKNAKKFILKFTSIKIKITILYSLSTFILLFAVCVFSYFEMKSIIDKKNHQFVLDEVNTVLGLMDHISDDYSELIQEVQEIPNKLSKESTYSYYVRVIDVDKKYYIETKSMSKIFENSNFFKNTIFKSMQAETQNWISKENKNYLLMRKNIFLKKRKWIIQVALDTSYETKKVSEYWSKLLLTFLFGTCVAIFLGYIIARKGMNKLYELTEVTKKVTSSSLNIRINPEDWPVELRNLGHAVNQMLDRIEEAFQRLTQFSSDLSHELRTPINNLLGEIEVVLTPGLTHENYKEVLESSIEEVNRIKQIIENILFLAKTENPKFDIEKTKIKIEDEFNFVINYFQSMADDMDIKILCYGQGEILGNSIMLRRMISNILSNALKYSFPNKNIYINFYEIENDSIKIIIRDEGKGIAKEHLPKIFDRFYRVDQSRSQNSGGVGLGLAIVKSIVDLHHGSIFISSQMNKGTTIEINFPKMT